MPNEVNISINGKQKTLRGWPATVMIVAALVLLALGAESLVSAVYSDLL